MIQKAIICHVRHSRIAHMYMYIYIYTYTLDRIKRPFRFFFNDPLIKVFDTTKKSSPEKIIEIGADFRVAP